MTRIVTDDWLRAQYLDAGRSCADIGHEIKRDSTTVRLWLLAARIPTRPRGSNPAVHFKKGTTSAFKGRRHTPEAIAKVRAATVADGRVPYLKNGVHHTKGKRGAVVANWKGGVTPERQTLYRSEAWRDAIKVTWKRADARCERCGIDYRTVKRGPRGTFHVHHLLSFVCRELRTEPTNLALLCTPCHRFVHSSRNVAGMFLAEPIPAASVPTLFDLDAPAAAAAT